MWKVVKMTRDTDYYQIVMHRKPLCVICLRPIEGSFDQNAREKGNTLPDDWAACGCKWRTHRNCPNCCAPQPTKPEQTQALFNRIPYD